MCIDNQINLNNNEDLNEIYNNADKQINQIDIDDIPLNNSL